jgi:hypothetical protein
MSMSLTHRDTARTPVGGDPSTAKSWVGALELTAAIALGLTPVN